MILCYIHPVFLISHYLQHVLAHNESSTGRQIQGNIFVSMQLQWRTLYMHLFVQRIQQHKTQFLFTGQCSINTLCSLQQDT
jgi:hypothetical protein